MRQEGTPTPVLADEREQAMLDLVPLAGARRERGHVDGQSALIGEPRQLPFAQTNTGSIAAAAVGPDQQRASPRVGRLAHMPPPAADRGHREGRRYVFNRQIPAQSFAPAATVLIPQTPGFRPGRFLGPLIRRPPRPVPERPARWRPTHRFRLQSASRCPG